MEKFVLLVDLGIITVPSDYSHENCLTLFKHGNTNRFFHFTDIISDENFSNPSFILKSDDSFHVLVFKQTVHETTSDERISFLVEQGSVFPNVQGSSLVFEKKRSELPKDYWYVSFDHADNVFKDSKGNLYVSNFYVGIDRGFRFDLGNFNMGWFQGSAFFCFKYLGQQTF